MGQVPTFDATPFGIVGDGRLARHLQHYFDLLGLPVRSWSRCARWASCSRCACSLRDRLDSDS